MEATLRLVRRMTLQAAVISLVLVELNDVFLKRCNLRRMPRPVYCLRPNDSCRLFAGIHVGDERHDVFECPAFDDIRHGFQHLFDDSHGAMRLLMWHPCQKDVASCLLQLLDRIDETLR